MKRTAKSHCPVNYALEVVGDNWSLLIVRDIVFWGKKTYGEFLRSSEAIATNILTNRLNHLVGQGILLRSPHPSDKRKDVYRLTEKGLDLIPIVLELSGWSARYDPQTAAYQKFVNDVYNNRKKMYELVRKTVAGGGSIFGEPGLVKTKS